MLEVHWGEIACYQQFLSNSSEKMFIDIGGDAKQRMAKYSQLKNSHEKSMDIHCTILITLLFIWNFFSLKK
jgi:hypothetical protein